MNLIFPVRIFMAQLHPKTTQSQRQQGFFVELQVRFAYCDKRFTKSPLGLENNFFILSHQSSSWWENVRWNWIRTILLSGQFIDDYGLSQLLKVYNSHQSTLYKALSFDLIVWGLLQECSRKVPIYITSHWGTWGHIVREMLSIPMP